MMPTVMNCFIKVPVEDREEECGRPRAKPTDLCCADHWQRVPKELRVKLIDAGKTRSLRERERLTINAATAVVEYLKAQKIQLPPTPVLLVSGGPRLETKLSPLVKEAPARRVVAQPKLIIPGR